MKSFLEILNFSCIYISMYKFLTTFIFFSCDKRRKKRPAEWLTSSSSFKSRCVEWTLYNPEHYKKLSIILSLLLSLQETTLYKMWPSTPPLFFEKTSKYTIWWHRGRQCKMIQVMIKNRRKKVQNVLHGRIYIQRFFFCISSSSSSTASLLLNHAIIVKKTNFLNQSCIRFSSNGLANSQPPISYHQQQRAEIIRREQHKQKKYSSTPSEREREQKVFFGWSTINNCSCKKRVSEEEEKKRI